MSKIYDDLKRKLPREFSTGATDAQPDLFSYSALQANAPTPSNKSAPSSDGPVGTEPPRKGPEYPDTPAGQSWGSSQPRRSLSSVLEPLSTIPLSRKRSVKAWLYASLVLALFVLGGIGIRKILHHTSRSTNPLVAHEPAYSKPQPVPPPPTSPQRMEELSQPPPAPRSTVQRWLVPGARTESINGVDIISFEEGLFADGVQLMPAARRALTTLARQLTPYGPRVSVIVIGCTDNVPLNPGSRFKDNTELGLARAREVARVLQSASKLPESTFHIASSGESWAPYPNDTPQNRARNRTAVLRVYLKP